MLEVRPHVVQSVFKILIVLKTRRALIKNVVTHVQELVASMLNVTLSATILFVVAHQGSVVIHLHFVNNQLVCVLSLLSTQ